MPKEDTQFKPGVSGNPGGRPRNPLKDFQREVFAAMTKEEKIEYLKDIAKLDKWKMVEGNPDSNADITSAGESIIPILVKFINGKDDTDTPGVQKPI